MKTAFLKKPEELSVIEMDIPKLEDGEALVRVQYTAVCGSDQHVYMGHHATAVYPVIPGHEFVGTLVDYNGHMKDSITMGDTVVAQPYYACGHCEPCITGRDNVCSKLAIFGVHTNGCFGEYVKVPIRKLYKLPSTVPTMMGTLTEPLAVAVHDVRMSGLQCGETALVSGGGPIGMLIAIVARMAGATVYISEVSDFRLAFAEKMGFQTINPMKETLKDAAKKVNDGNGFDVVFETSGAKASISSITDAAKICGTIVIIGIAKEDYPFSTNGIYSKELKVVGVRVHSQQAFEGAIKILSSGVINDDLQQIMDEKIYTLDEVKDAMEYCIHDMNHFKTIIQVSK